MSELEQWCEIDGHQWTIFYQEMGLILGGDKTTYIHKTCSFCKTTECKIFTTPGVSLANLTMPLFY